MIENLRLGWATCVVISTLVFACSHEEERTEAPRASRTSGDERRDDDRRDRERADATSDDDTTGGDGELPTAFDQSNDEDDLAITQAIRTAVVEDGELSFAARNCVIVTVDHVVTLRGNVNTADERARIEAHARGTDGVTRVENELAVDP